MDIPDLLADYQNLNAEGVSIPVAEARLPEIEDWIAAEKAEVMRRNEIVQALEKVAAALREAGPSPRP